MNVADQIVGSGFSSTELRNKATNIIKTQPVQRANSSCSRLGVSVRITPLWFDA
ncbi:hypothetical protein VCRA2119O381_1890001 [Vibrio crassostreae]|nr:hypothetical protein VCRA2119O381_1890001 [Vibrio crassostreae]